MLLLCSGAFAANDQTFVIGAGLGPFEYSKSDDFRRSLTGPSGPLSEFEEESQGQFYVEWYALEEIGFGLRYHRSGGFQGEGFVGDREVFVDSLLVTAQWVPIGATSYARVGFLAGLGTASYDVTIDFEGVSPVSESTSGTAMLLGAYVDWGGPVFGARAGINVLTTDLDDVNGLSADGSGRGLYLDLRWALE